MKSLFVLLAATTAFATAAQAETRMPPMREVARQTVVHHGEMFHFHLGPTGNLMVRRGHDGRHEDLGGVLTSIPYALNHMDHIYIFGRGTDNAIWFRTMHQGWQSLGGWVAQILEIYRIRGEVYIVVVGQHGHRYMRTLNSGWVKIHR